MVFKGRCIAEVPENMPSRPGTGVISWSITPTCQQRSHMLQGRVAGVCLAAETACETLIASVALAMRVVKPVRHVLQASCMAESIGASRRGRKTIFWSAPPYKLFSSSRTLQCCSTTAMSASFHMSAYPAPQLYCLLLWPWCCASEICEINRLFPAACSYLNYTDDWWVHSSAPVKMGMLDANVHAHVLHDCHTLRSDCEAALLRPLLQVCAGITPQ